MNTRGRVVVYSPLAEVHRADPRWVPWIPILVAVHRTTGSKSTPDHPRALREQLTSASAFDQLHLTSAPRQCVGAKCAYSYQGLALPGRQVNLLPPCYQYGGYVFRAEHRAKTGFFGCSTNWVQRCLTASSGTLKQNTEGTH